MDKAVLVGIEIYDSNLVNNLTGCLNDVSGIQQFLTAFAGFDSGNIVTLQNAQATRNGILQELSWLATGLSPGDRLVFHYSGHGSQLPINGVLEDVIVPADFAPPTSNAITGSELATLFANIPVGASFSWISDSCNSGGLERTLDETTRYLKPSAALQPQITQLLAQKKISFVRDLVAALNLVLYAACAENEVANGAPIDNVPHGVFSYYLTTLLRDATTANSPASQLMAAAKAAVAQSFPNQDPQLHGNQALFESPFLPRIASPIRALTTHYSLNAIISPKHESR